MVNPLGAEHIERLPDVLGRPFFAGVCNGTEPGADRLLEDVAELLRGVAHLCGIEPDAEDHVTVRERLLERRHRVIAPADHAGST